MNEIKHIHLGRQQFTIAVDAHTSLRHYLDDIAKQAGAMSSDVVAEVELRMAELLIERGCGGEKVVLLQDIDFLKAQLGEPSDFKDDSADADEVEEKPQQTPKRLYRDTEHGLVAGVAAGLANFLGIDPLIVRLAFVLVTFAGGSSFLIYILLWLLVPEAKTASDKLSMRGKRVTVDNLKDMIDSADVPGAARRAQHALQRVLAIVGKTVLAIAGSLLTIVSSLALLFVMIIATNILISGAKVAGEVVFPFGGHEIVAFSTGVAAIAIALLLLILTGIAMIRRHWQLPAWGTAALVGLFFVAATFGTAFAADVVPSVTDRVKGLQHQTTSELAPFSSADFNGKDTRFSFVSDQQYYIEYHYLGSVDMSSVDTKVEGMVLKVNTDNVVFKDSCSFMCVYSDSELRIVVHAPTLENVKVNGEDATFTSSKVLNQKQMVVDVGTDAWVTITNIDAQAVKLKAEASGPRHIEMTLGSEVTDDFNGISLFDDGTVTVRGAKQVAVETQSHCDESNPFIFLRDTAGATVNGRAVSPKSFDTDPIMSFEEANCVDSN